MRPPGTPESGIFYWFLQYFGGTALFPALMPFWVLLEAPYATLTDSGVEFGVKITPKSGKKHTQKLTPKNMQKGAGKWSQHGRAVSG